MVTKRGNANMLDNASLILAKNHMVTKLQYSSRVEFSRLILAKNHMVTKQVATF